jgi:GT2 family glycosyltransferase
LIQQSYRFYKIILVDHGSTDGSYNFLLAHYPDIIILKGESTLWWTGATNLGVKKAIELSTSTDDFILTLNNDLVVGHNYLEEILNVFISGKPCIVGSVSVNIKENLKVEFAGLKWNNITAKYSKPKEFKSDLSDLLESSLWIESDLLPGRGTLIPLIAFKQIGLFDEYNFPHYAADEDFSLRCKKNGYRLLVSTKSIVKSHIDESGIEVKNRGNMRKKNLILLFQSFKSLKSGINLKIRFNWARKNTPFPHLYFMFDLIRIVFSFYFK